MKQNKSMAMELRNLMILTKRFMSKNAPDSKMTSKHNPSKEKICKENMEGHHGHGHSHGPTHMQMLVMGYLIENKDKDIYQKDIEKEFSIRRPTATSMLKRMENHGVITRVPVPDDARLKKIVVSKKALAHSKDMDKHNKIMEETMTRGLSKEEIDTFMITLEKIKKNLEEE